MNSCRDSKIDCIAAEKRKGPRRSPWWTPSSDLINNDDFTALGICEKANITVHLARVTIKLRKPFLLFCQDVVFNNDRSEFPSNNKVTRCANSSPPQEVATLMLNWLKIGGK